MANFQDCHEMTALAPKRVIAKGQRKRRSPSVEGCEEASFFFGNSQKDFVGMYMMFGVKTVISNHFKVFFRNMNNKPFNKLGGGDFFCNQFIILMPVVVKGNKITVIIINTGGSDDGSAEISADVSDDVLRVCKSGFSVDIKAVRAMFVYIRFCFFERVAYLFVHVI